MKVCQWIKEMTLNFIILNKPNFQRLIWQLMLLADRKCLTVLGEVISKELKIRWNPLFGQTKLPWIQSLLLKTVTFSAPYSFLWATVMMLLKTLKIYLDNSLINSLHLYVTCRDKTCPHAQYGPCRIQNTPYFFPVRRGSLPSWSDLLFYVPEDSFWSCSWAPLPLTLFLQNDFVSKRRQQKSFGNESGRKTYSSLADRNHVLGLHSKVLVVGAHGGGPCEKVIEASSVSHGASVRQFQDRPAIGQGWAYQWPRESLWDNVFKRENPHNAKCSQRVEREYVRRTALQTPRSVHKEGDGPGARAEIPLKSLWTLDKSMENCLKWEKPHAGAVGRVSGVFPQRRK